MLIDLLINTPKWKPGFQGNTPVWQRHRVAISIQRNSIEDVVMQPPNLEAHNMMTLFLMQNLNLSKRENNDAALLEIYVSFEHSKTTRTINNIKLINCTDAVFENELLRVLNETPYQLIYDVYPEGMTLIQPVIIVFRADAQRSRPELPVGVMQKDIVINYNNNIRRKEH